MAPLLLHPHHQRAACLLLSSSPDSRSIIRAEGKSQGCSWLAAASRPRGAAPSAGGPPASQLGSSPADAPQHHAEPRRALAAAAAGPLPGSPGSLVSSSSKSSLSAEEAQEVRLATAAAILAASPSTTDLQDAASLASEAAASGDDAPASLSGDSNSSSAAPLASQGNSNSGSGSDVSLAALDDISVLDADSLSLAIGILRQRQPTDAGSEADVQLSERLRDLLLLLRRRPEPGVVAGAAAAAAAGVVGAGTQQAGAADSGTTTTTNSIGGSSSGGCDGAADSFWAPPDEWADVRSALMGIGINASLDEEDEEEDVWTQEAGVLTARRTRLLRRLPKLDGETAQELAAFLTELQQRQVPAQGSPAGQQRDPPVPQHVAVSKEQEQWWAQAELAYGLLQQQAKAQQDPQQPEEQDKKGSA